MSHTKSKVDQAMCEFENFLYWFKGYVKPTSDDISIYGAMQARLGIAVYEAMIEEIEQVEAARTGILASLECRIRRMELRG